MDDGFLCPEPGFLDIKDSSDSSSFDGKLHADSADRTSNGETSIIKLFFGKTRKL